MVVGNESKDSGDDCAANGDAPEDDRTVCKVKYTLVQDKADDEASPGCKDSNTNALHSLPCNDVSNDETDDGRASKHSPAYPILSVVLQESRVEKQKDSGHRNEKADQENGGDKQFPTEESQEDTANNQTGAPEPTVLVEELPNGA